MNKTFNTALNRLSSLLIGLIFTINSLVVSPSYIYAASDPNASTIPALGNLSLESLPADFGTLKDLQLPSGNNPFVIHIQDAHANPDAQTKIQSLLRWIYENRQEKKMLVGLEGAMGAIHPEYFEYSKEFPAVSEAIVKDLHEKGEITGAELFAWEVYKKNNDARSKMQDTGKNVSPESGILNPESISFLGIENAPLYRDNLKTYRELIFKRDEVTKSLDPIEKDLEVAKSRFLSPDMKDFFREKSRRKDGEFGTAKDTNSAAQMQVYLGYLANLSKEKLGIDLNDRIEQLRFPNYTRMLALEQLLKKAELETEKLDKNRLTNDLKPKLRLEADKALLAQAAALNASHEPRAVLEALFELTLKYRLNLRTYPGFLHEAGRFIVQSEINPEGLFEEVSRLETLAVEKMVTTPQEKELVNAMQSFATLKKLTSLELSRAEFVHVQDHLDELKPLEIGKKVASLLKKKASTDANGFFEDAVHFYRTAEKRDTALLNNFLGISSESSIKVLITGGFHTDGFKALMKEKGMGYAVIQPKITQFPDKDLSYKVFTDQNADLSNYVKSNPLNAQQSLFLKELLEVGLPVLRDKKVPFSAAVEMINSHTILSEAVEAKQAPVNAVVKTLSTTENFNELFSNLPGQRFGADVSAAGIGFEIKSSDISILAKPINKTKVASRSESRDVSVVEMGRRLRRDLAQHLESELEKRMPGSARGRAAVDIAGGEGDLSQILLRLFPTTYSLELRPAEAKRLGERLGNILEVIPGNFNSLLERISSNQRFDAIVATRNVADYFLAGKNGNNLADAMRRLKKSGLFVFVHSNREAHPGNAAEIRNLFTRKTPSAFKSFDQILRTTARTVETEVFRKDYELSRDEAIAMVYALLPHENRIQLEKSEEGSVERYVDRVLKVAESDTYRIAVENEILWATPREEEKEKEETHPDAVRSFVALIKKQMEDGHTLDLIKVNQQIYRLGDGPLQELNGLDQAFGVKLFDLASTEFHQPIVILSFKKGTGSAALETAIQHILYPATVPLAKKASMNAFPISIRTQAYSEATRNGNGRTLSLGDDDLFKMAGDREQLFTDLVQFRETFSGFVLNISAARSETREEGTETISEAAELSKLSSELLTILTWAKGAGRDNISRQASSHHEYLSIHRLVGAQVDEIRNFIQNFLPLAQQTEPKEVTLAAEGNELIVGTGRFRFFDVKKGGTRDVARPLGDAEIEALRKKIVAEIGGQKVIGWGIPHEGNGRFFLDLADATQLTVMADRTIVRSESRKEDKPIQGQISSLEKLKEGSSAYTFSKAINASAKSSLAFALIDQVEKNPAISAIGLAPESDNVGSSENLEAIKWFVLPRDDMDERRLRVAIDFMPFIRSSGKNRFLLHTVKFTPKDTAILKGRESLILLVVPTPDDSLLQSRAMPIVTTASEPSLAPKAQAVRSLSQPAFPTAPDPKKPTLNLINSQNFWWILGIGVLALGAIISGFFLLGGTASKNIQPSKDSHNVSIPSQTKSRSEMRSTVSNARWKSLKQIKDAEEYDGLVGKAMKSLRESAEAFQLHHRNQRNDYALAMELIQERFGKTPDTFPVSPLRFLKYYQAQDNPMEKLIRGTFAGELSQRGYIFPKSTPAQKNAGDSFRSETRDNSRETGEGSWEEFDQFMQSMTLIAQKERILLLYLKLLWGHYESLSEGEIIEKLNEQAYSTTPLSPEDHSLQITFYAQTQFEMLASRTLRIDQRYRNFGDALLSVYNYFSELPTDEMEKIVSEYQLPGDQPRSEVRPEKDKPLISLTTGTSSETKIISGRYVPAESEIIRRIVAILQVIFKSKQILELKPDAELITKLPEREQADFLQKLNEDFHIQISKDQIAKTKTVLNVVTLVVRTLQESRSEVRGIDSMEINELYSLIRSLNLGNQRRGIAGIFSTIIDLTAEEKWAQLKPELLKVQQMIQSLKLSAAPPVISRISQMTVKIDGIVRAQEIEERQARIEGLKAKKDILNKAVNDRLLVLAAKELTGEGKAFKEKTAITLEDLKQDLVGVKIRISDDKFKLYVYPGKKSGLAKGDSNLKLFKIAELPVSQDPAKAPSLWILTQALTNGAPVETENYASSIVSLYALINAAAAAPVEAEKLADDSVLPKIGDKVGGMGGSLSTVVAPEQAPKLEKWMQVHAAKGEKILLIKIERDAALKDILGSGVFKKFEFKIAKPLSGDIVMPDQVSTWKDFSKGEMIALSFVSRSEARDKKSDFRGFVTQVQKVESYEAIQILSMAVRSPNILKTAQKQPAEDLENAFNLSLADLIAKIQNLSTVNPWYIFSSEKENFSSAVSSRESSILNRDLASGALVRWVHVTVGASIYVPSFGEQGSYWNGSENASYGWAPEGSPELKELIKQAEQWSPTQYDDDSRIDVRYEGVSTYETLILPRGQQPRSEARFSIKKLDERNGGKEFLYQVAGLEEGKEEPLAVVLDLIRNNLKAEGIPSSRVELNGLERSSMAIVRTNVKNDDVVTIEFPLSVRSEIRSDETETLTVKSVLIGLVTVGALTYGFAKGYDVWQKSRVQKETEQQTTPAEISGEQSLRSEARENQLPAGFEQEDLAVQFDVEAPKLGALIESLRNPDFADLVNRLTTGIWDESDIVEARLILSRSESRWIPYEKGDEYLDLRGWTEQKILKKLVQLNVERNQLEGKYDEANLLPAGPVFLFTIVTQAFEAKEIRRDLESVDHSIRRFNRMLTLLRARSEMRPTSDTSDAVDDKDAQGFYRNLKPMVAGSPAPEFSQSAKVAEGERSVEEGDQSIKKDRSESRTTLISSMKETIKTAASKEMQKPNPELDLEQVQNLRTVSQLLDQIQENLETNQPRVNTLARRAIGKLQANVWKEPLVDYGALALEISGFVSRSEVRDENKTQYADPVAVKEMAQLEDRAVQALRNLKDSLDQVSPEQYYVRILLNHLKDLLKDGEFFKARALVEGISDLPQYKKIYDQTHVLAFVYEEINDSYIRSGRGLGEIKLRANEDGQTLEFFRTTAEEYGIDFVPQIHPSAVVQQVEAKSNGQKILFFRGTDEGDLELVRADGFRIVIYKDKPEVSLLVPRSEIRFAVEKWDAQSIRTAMDDLQRNVSLFDKGQVTADLEVLRQMINLAGDFHKLEGTAMKSGNPLEFRAQDQASFTRMETQWKELSGRLKVVEVRSETRDKEIGPDAVDDKDAQGFYRNLKPMIAGSPAPEFSQSAKAAEGERPQVEEGNQSIEKDRSEVRGSAKDSKTFVSGLLAVLTYNQVTKIKLGEVEVNMPALANKGRQGNLKIIEDQLKAIAARNFAERVYPISWALSESGELSIHRSESRFSVEKKSQESAHFIYKINAAPDAGEILLTSALDAIRAKNEVLNGAASVNVKINGQDVRPTDTRRMIVHDGDLISADFLVAMTGNRSEVRNFSKQIASADSSARTETSDVKSIPVWQRDVLDVAAYLAEISKNPDAILQLPKGFNFFYALKNISRRNPSTNGNPSLLRSFAADYAQYAAEGSLSNTARVRRLKSSLQQMLPSVSKIIDSLNVPTPISLEEASNLVADSRIVKTIILPLEKNQWLRLRLVSLDPQGLKSNQKIIELQYAVDWISKTPTRFIMETPYTHLRVMFNQAGKVFRGGLGKMPATGLVSNTNIDKFLLDLVLKIKGQDFNVENLRRSESRNADPLIQESLEVSPLVNDREISGLIAQLQALHDPKLQELIEKLQQKIWEEEDLAEAKRALVLYDPALTMLDVLPLFLEKARTIHTRFGIDMDGGDSYPNGNFGKVVIRAFDKDLPEIIRLIEINFKNQSDSKTVPPGVRFTAVNLLKEILSGLELTEPEWEQNSDIRKNHIQLVYAAEEISDLISKIEERAALRSETRAEYTLPSKTQVALDLERFKARPYSITMEVVPNNGNGNSESFAIESTLKDRATALLFLQAIQREFDRRLKNPKSEFFNESQFLDAMKRWVTELKKTPEGARWIKRSESRTVVLNGKSQNFELIPKGDGLLIKYKGKLLSSVGDFNAENLVTALDLALSDPHFFDNTNYEFKTWVAQDNPKQIYAVLTPKYLPENAERYTPYLTESLHFNFTHDNFSGLLRMLERVAPFLAVSSKASRKTPNYLTLAQIIDSLSGMGFKAGRDFTITNYSPLAFYLEIHRSLESVHEYIKHIKKLGGAFSNYAVKGPESISPMAQNNMGYLVGLYYGEIDIPGMDGKGAEARSELRKPKIVFSQFSDKAKITSKYKDKDMDMFRELYAFLPAAGKYSVTLKIGGTSIGGAILDHEGNTLQELKDIKVFPDKAKAEDFKQYIDRKVKEGQLGKTRDEVLKRLSDDVLDKMSEAVSQLLQNPAMKGKIQLLDRIGISSPGPFVQGGVDRRGEFATDTVNLPFAKGMILSEEILNRVSKKLGQKLTQKVEVLHDGAAGLFGEVSALGTVPGEEDAFYIIWGTGIGAGLLNKGQLFTGGDIVQHLLGEFGHSLVWFPETKSYEYVGVWSKGLPHHLANQFYSKYQDVEDRISGGNLPNRYKGRTAEQLTDEELEEIGWEMGQAVGAFMKGIAAQFGASVVPKKVVIGSGVSHLGEKLRESVERGLQEEYDRPLKYELGHVLGRRAFFENEKGTQKALQQKFGAKIIKDAAAAKREWKKISKTLEIDDAAKKNLAGVDTGAIFENLFRYNGPVQRLISALSEYHHPNAPSFLPVHFKVADEPASKPGIRWTAEKITITYPSVAFKDKIENYLTVQLAHQLTLRQLDGSIRQIQESGQAVPMMVRDTEGRQAFYMDFSTVTDGILQAQVFRDIIQSGAATTAYDVFLSLKKQQWPLAQLTPQTENQAGPVQEKLHRAMGIVNHLLMIAPFKSTPYYAQVLTDLKQAFSNQEVERAAALLEQLPELKEVTDSQETVSLEQAQTFSMAATYSVGWDILHEKIAAQLGQGVENKIKLDKSLQPLLQEIVVQVLRGENVDLDFSNAIVTPLKADGTKFDPILFREWASKKPASFDQVTVSSLTLSRSETRSVGEFYEYLETHHISLKFGSDPKEQMIYLHYDRPAEDELNEGSVALLIQGFPLGNYRSGDDDASASYKITNSSFYQTLVAFMKSPGTEKLSERSESRKDLSSFDPALVQALEQQGIVLEKLVKEGALTPAEVSLRKKPSANLERIGIYWMYTKKKSEQEIANSAAKGPWAEDAIHIIYNSENNNQPIFVYYAPAKAEPMTAILNPGQYERFLQTTPRSEARREEPVSLRAKVIAGLVVAGAFGISLAWISYKISTGPQKKPVPVVPEKSEEAPAVPAVDSRSENRGNLILKRSVGDGIVIENGYDLKVKKIQYPNVRIDINGHEDSYREGQTYPLDQDTSFFVKEVRGATVYIAILAPVSVRVFRDELLNGKLLPAVFSVKIKRFVRNSSRHPSLPGYLAGLEMEEIPGDESFRPFLPWSLMSQELRERLDRDELNYGDELQVEVKKRENQERQIILRSARSEVRSQTPASASDSSNEPKKVQAKAGSVKEFTGIETFKISDPKPIGDPSYDSDQVHNLLAIMRSLRDHEKIDNFLITDDFHLHGSLNRSNIIGLQIDGSGAGRERREELWKEAQTPLKKAVEAFLDENKWASKVQAVRGQITINREGGLREGNAVAVVASIDKAAIKKFVEHLMPALNKRLVTSPAFTKNPATLLDFLPGGRLEMTIYESANVFKVTFGNDALIQEPISVKTSKPEEGLYTLAKLLWNKELLPNYNFGSDLIELYLYASQGQKLNLGDEGLSQSLPVIFQLAKELSVLKTDTNKIAADAADIYELAMGSAEIPAAEHKAAGEQLAELLRKALQNGIKVPDLYNLSPGWEQLLQSARQIKASGKDYEVWLNTTTQEHEIQLREIKSVTAPTDRSELRNVAAKSPVLQLPGSTVNLRQTILKAPVQNVASFVTDAQKYTAQAADGFWWLPAFTQKISNLLSFARILIPEANAVEIGSPLQIQIEKNISLATREALFTAKSGSQPIHLLMGIETDEIPASVPVFLQTAQPQDKITLVLNRFLTPEEAEKLTQAFLGSYGLQSRAANIQIKGLQRPGQALDAAVLVAASGDKDHAVGIVDARADFLRRIQSQIPAASSPRSIQLLWSGLERTADFVVLIGGTALRHQLTDKPEIRNVPQELQGLYNIEDLAAQFGRLMGVVRHLHTQA